MKPTGLRLLTALFVISAPLGWAVADLVDGLFGRILPVPWTAAVTLAVLALALLIWAIGMHRKLKNKEHINPFVAARTAALAMAASRTGAVAAGAYGGILIWFASQWQIPIARDRSPAAAAAMVAGLAMVAAALWLERVCRLPAGSDDDEGGTGTAEAGADWVHPRVG